MNGEDKEYGERGPAKLAHEVHRLMVELQQTDESGTPAHFRMDMGIIIHRQNVAIDRLALAIIKMIESEY